MRKVSGSLSSLRNSGLCRVLIEEFRSHWYDGEKAEAKHDVVWFLCCSLYSHELSVRLFSQAKSARVHMNHLHSAYALQYPFDCPHCPSHDPTIAVSARQYTLCVGSWLLFVCALLMPKLLWLTVRNLTSNTFWKLSRTRMKRKCKTKETTENSIETLEFFLKSKVEAAERQWKPKKTPWKRNQF